MYKTALRVILCALMLATFFLDEAFAQERSLGGTFSYAGTGVEYVHYHDDRHFAQYQLRVETAGIYWSELGKTGVSASAFWNTIFATIESRNGNTIKFFAGPGITTGYSCDFMIPQGVILGLKGRAGAECSFARGVVLSLSLSPMIGGHFRGNNGMINMRLYRTGLLYGIMPEAGIRYIF